MGGAVGRTLSLMCIVWGCLRPQVPMARENGDFEPCRMRQYLGRILLVLLFVDDDRGCMPPDWFGKRFVPGPTCSQAVASASSPGL